MSVVAKTERLERLLFNAMATQANPWSDFDVVLGELRTMTVNSLKGVITGLVEEGCANIGKAGRKSELQERIVRALRLLQTDGKVDKWIKARAVVLQVGSGLDYDSNTLSRFMESKGPSVQATPIKNTSPFHAPYGSSGTYYNPSSRPGLGAPGPSKYGSGLSEPKWRHSSFYRIDQAVSPVTECPESASSTDRRSVRFNFYLNADQVAKLASRSPKYQLRLYCTTSQYYITLGTSFRNTPCPVEFPPTCEVRVNNRVLTANFRGIKKKAGTAPPADITDMSLRGQGAGNQVEMIYVNSNQATGPKKFYLIVNLVEVTAVDELVDRLRKRIESKDKVIAAIKARQTDDDEVQAGPTKVSLRDPLTYTRIGLPCRASSCVHLNCFDATCWYAMMEQTSTWLCPICDRVLDPDDLIIDGFIADILQNVHEDEEDVMIEADGQWHTQDGKAGSAAWMAKHGVVTTNPPAFTAKPERASPPPLSTAPSASTITIDDSSDSEEENEVKRELSPPRIPPAVNSKSTAQAQPPPPSSGPVVIDLTLSDSEEEGEVPPRQPPSRAVPPIPASVLGKRKLSSDGELATGSSRRTSTAASYRTSRADEDDYIMSHDRHHSNGYYYGSAAGGNLSGALPSPTSPPARVPSNGSSPAIYPYPSGPNLPSPTMSSSSVANSHSHPQQQWNANRPPSFSLPPASSLLSNGPLPPISTLPPPAHSPGLPPLPPLPQPSRPARPSYLPDRRESPRERYGDSRSSSSSRYPEWGLRH